MTGRGYYCAVTSGDEILMEAGGCRAVVVMVMVQRTYHMKMVMKVSYFGTVATVRMVVTALDTVARVMMV